MMFHSGAMYKWYWMDGLDNSTGRPRKKLVSEFVIALLYGMIRD